MIFRRIPPKIFPLIHDNNIAYSHGLETGVANQSTIVMICHHDEVGNPTSIETHPENAAFEDIAAKDEKTGETAGTVLELQQETTDRQTFPLYNDVKMVERFSNSALMPAPCPGLTTTQVLEGVAFNIDTYYDAIHYFTNSGKIKSMQSGLKWFTLSRQHPQKSFKIDIHPRTKMANQYMMGAIMTIVPAVDTHHQYPISTDTKSSSVTA